MKTDFFIIFAASVLVPGLAHARWATPQDATLAIESRDLDIKVHADGTSESTNTVVSEVLREGGRSLSTARLHYNSNAGSLKILEAETINGTEHFSVASEHIEDKPVAGQLHGFDDIHAVTVAFPKVGIGSKTRIKSRTKIENVPIPDTYSTRLHFGHDEYIKNETVRLTSALPLYLEKNDPQGKLDITERKVDDKFEVVIQLKSPQYTSVIDEPAPVLNRKDITWVVLSTVKTYPELRQHLAVEYEKILTAELPPLFADILLHAKAKTSRVDQINTITSELATAVRYMGDWRPIKGGYIPRQLAEIAKTRFGDCKDFATVTAALMRRLGLDSHTAAVQRGYVPEVVTTLANMGAFNHAIVWAKDGEQVYWVDPTNFSSFADGIFEDIAGRKSLVMDPRGSHLEDIPETAPSAVKRIRTFVSNIQPNGDALVKARLQFKGSYATSWTGEDLKFSKEKLEHDIFSWLAAENRLAEKKVEPFDLSSRITKDIEFVASYREKRVAMRSTVGPAYQLPEADFSHIIMLEAKTRASDVFLGHPHTKVTEDRLENVSLVGSKPPQCHIKSPWINVTRKVTLGKRGILISDVEEIKTVRITNSELHSPAFEKFQRDVQKCFERVVLVYKLDEPSTRLPANELQK